MGCVARMAGLPCILKSLGVAVALAHVVAAVRRCGTGGIAVFNFVRWMEDRALLHAGRVLPEELVRKILLSVPRPVQVVSTFGLFDATLWGGVAPTPRRTLQGHERVIVDVHFFPAGDRLLTAGRDGKTIIWSAASGRPLRALARGHAEHVELFEARIFPDGTRLITVASDARAIVWSATHGKVLLRINFSGICDLHRAVRMFPAGDRVATGVSHVRGDPVVIWRVSDGGALHRLAAPAGGAILSLALSPCGRKLATTSSFGIQVWDADAGRLDRQLSEPSGRTSQVVISEGGAKLAGGIGDSVYIWEAEGDRPRRALAMDGRNVEAFALLPGGRRVVVATNTDIAIWDADTGERLHELRLTCGIVPHRIVASSSGEVVAACGGTIELLGGYWMVVWDARTGRELGSIRGGRGHSFCQVALGPTSMFEALGV